MKIDFKTLYENNFNINISSSKRVNSNFEEYLKIALAQIKEEKLTSEKYSEKLREVLHKIETSLEILENLPLKNLDTSSSETLGDFLLSQALELNQILNSLPEEKIKPFLKELTFFIGVEAQKIRKGFYS